MPRHMNRISHAIPNLKPPVTQGTHMDVRIYEKQNSLHIQVAITFPDDKGLIQHFTRSQEIPNLSTIYEAQGAQDFYLNVITALRQALADIQTAIQAAGPGP